MWRGYVVAAVACASISALSLSIARPSLAQSVAESIVRFPEDVVYKGLPGAPQHVTLMEIHQSPGSMSIESSLQPGPG